MFYFNDIFTCSDIKNNNIIYNNNSIYYIIAFACKLVIHKHKISSDFCYIINILFLL